MSDAIYRRSREALTEVYAHLDDAQLSRRVSETPLWSVRDVLGHLVGETEDFTTGKQNDAGSDAWTARQVARLADQPVSALLERWAETGPAMEALIEADPRRWTFSTHDIWCHEHDVRAALALPRRVDEEAIRYSASATWAVRARCKRAELPVPEFVVDGETLLEGDGPTVRFSDLYEVGRVLFGRRSEDQVRALAWSGDPEPYLPLLSFFAYQPTDAHG